MSHSDDMRHLINLVESAQRVDEKGFMDYFRKPQQNQQQPAQAQKPQQPANAQQPAQAQKPAQEQQPQQPANGQQGQQPSSGKVTDTPAFKKWFGNSKIKGSNGPLRCFHGSTGDISGGIFKPSKTGVYGPGIYFATNPEAASAYATGARRTGGDGGEQPIQGQVTPVFLKMERPFQDAVLKQNSEFKTALVKLLNGGIRGMFKSKHDVVTNLLAHLKNNTATVTNVFYCVNTLAREQQQQLAIAILKLIREHFDGVVTAYTGKVGGKGAEMVVWYSSQVKSAVGNKGTFNPQSGNINEDDEEGDEEDVEADDDE